MRLRLRSLYTKIFLWFCLTVAVSTSLVFGIASMTGSQPFGRRYVEVTQDLYARTAVDLYTTGGAPALERYMAVLRSNSRIEGHLLERDATSGVLGEPVPPQDAGVLEQARRTGRSVSQINRHFWAAASVVSVGESASQRYIFILSAHPLQAILNGTLFSLAVPRIGGGLLLSALLCLLLARHITRPIRLLEAAATSMAGGDLSVRTLPALRGRTDELASMAAAFDGMAERIDGCWRTSRMSCARR
jgi:methyl-accepting chemotaxis protein